jgi:hypothetical protein
MYKILLLAATLTLGAIGCKKDRNCIMRDKFGNELGVTEGSEQCEKNINKANGEWCDCGNETNPNPTTAGSN